MTIFMGAKCPPKRLKKSLVSAFESNKVREIGARGGGVNS